MREWNEKRPSWEISSFFWRIFEWSQKFKSGSICRLYVSQTSLMWKIASNWACRYQGYSVMLLRERFETQFNHCSVPDRSLDFRLPSPPDVFPIDIHSSETFPFPDPRLGSNTWILASGLFNLMLNDLKHNIIGFVHFPGSSSEVLVVTFGQTIIWWKIVAALLFRSCLRCLHTLSWQKINTFINWLPAFLTRQPRERFRSLHDVPQNFGRRTRLNDTAGEAVEESAALRDSFPETEEPSQLPLSCSAWHPSEQRVQ
jgi:hypothetical protein